MKKSRIVLICFKIILLLIFLQLTGCSIIQPDEADAGIRGNSNVPGDPETDKINIQFAQWSVSSVQLVEEAVSGFNETNGDNIYVDIIKIPLERYIETLNMLNSSGDGPDVFEIVREWLSSYVNKGWVTDLQPYAGEDFLKSFPAWALKYENEYVKYKRLYSLPSNLITYRLIYNKDLFRESGLDPGAPPETLAELEKYAGIISDHGKGKRKYGFAQPIGELWMDFVLPMEASNAYSGVYFYDYEKNKYDLTVYEPWLLLTQKLNKNGGMFPGMDSMKSDLAMAQFAEGNIGMMYAASWQVSAFFNHLPPKCDWDVALPPATNEESAGKGSVIVNTAGWNVVGSKTKNPEEAVNVWEFLYSKDYLGKLSSKFSAIPVVDSMMENRAYDMTGKNFKKFLPGNEDSIYPNTPRNPDEWLRKNAYKEALSGDQMDQILLKENYRLNSLFN